MTTATAYPTQSYATPRLRITQRGSRVLMTLIAGPLVLLALAAALNGGAATATGDAVTTEYVSVESGESLWQLAETIAPTADPRDVIDAIVSLNQLESVDVYPGQQLALPSEYTN